MCKITLVKNIDKHSYCGINQELPYWFERSLMDEEIKKMCLAVNELAKKGLDNFENEVEMIISENLKDKKRIETVLDYMLGFCFDEDMLLLYKKLLRYYFKIDAYATAFYINSYREMWDESDE